MAGITIGGLATGLDSASIISKLLAVERLPEQVLQNTQKTDQSQIDIYSQLQTALTNLQNVATGMSLSSSFKGMLSTVADSTVAGVTASSSAIAGTHTLEVTTLATSQRQVSTGYADNTLFNSGSFTIDNGSGAVTTVNLADGNNSLQGIANAINGSGANVTASIVNDGSSTPNRLVIMGNDTANYTVDFSGLTTPPSTGDPAQVPTLLGSGDPSYQAGAPATFKLDGVSMTKTSNTVTDAISGVTVNLLKQGATTTFTVANDTAGVTTKINSFVTAYNAAITLVNNQSKYNTSTNTAGPLSGDTTVRTIQSQLQGLLTSVVSGASGSFNNLAQLGLTTDKSDGTLSVDSTKLTAALSSDFNGVVDLFTHNTGGSLSLPKNQYGIAQQFNLSLETLVHAYEGDGSTNNGLIATRIQGLNKSITDINDQVSQMEDRITALQTTLQTQFSNMELMVSNLQAQGKQLLAALGTSSSSSSSSSG
jgi:flagellar hook-associated protein 2